MFKKKLHFALLPLIAALCLLPLVACSVEKTQEGKLPDVDVEVEKGQLPHYDVDTAEVTVTTKEKEVKVPDVDIEVKTETKTIELPDIEVTMPDEKKENDEGGEGNN